MIAIPYCKHTKCLLLDFDLHMLEMKKSSSQKGNSEKKVRLTSPTPKEEDEVSKGTQRRELDEEGFSVSIQSLNDSVTSKLSNSGEHDRKTDETNQSKAKSDSVIKRIPTKGIMKLTICRVGIGDDCCVCQQSSFVTEQD